MKMKNYHVIPLTKQILELLEELKKYTWYSKYLFASDRASIAPVISAGTINKVYARAGYKNRLTGHGTRHTFKTLVSEHGWNGDWSEAQLAHIKKDEIEETYNQAKYLEPRRIMMQWYNDYLDALENGITEIQQKKFAALVNNIR